MIMRIKNKGKSYNYDFGSYTPNVWDTAKGEIVESCACAMLYIAILCSAIIWLIPLSNWWWFLAGSMIVYIIGAVYYICSNLEFGSRR